MNAGIDFGSTYSTVSKYKQSIHTVEPVIFAEGEPASIPSVVSISKKGQVTCGKGANEQKGKKSVKIYEAFKMLLIETKQEMLRKRGYDENHTPRQITRLFLKSVLEKVLQREEDEQGFGELVICVPEIWGKNVATLDGRTILREILTNEIAMPVKHVQIVTEPEAASAFFAYHFEQTTGRNFNGHLLLIDYGGGTLDITLTEVFSDGHGKMQIGYREGGGAGENHPGEKGEGAIGTAGIAYMQNVILHALRDAKLLKEGEVPDYTSPDFITAVKDLESQLKSWERSSEIEDFFGSFGSFKKLHEVLAEEPTEFIALEFDGEEIPVTFQQLFLAYQETIENVLSEQIHEINENVKKHIMKNPCDPDAGVDNRFKIALVGGFASFYLVKKQIAEIYNFDANVNIDLRTKDIPQDKREQAISLGAALIAEGKIVLQKTSRYSIGLYANQKLYYGIRYHQTIETNKPYFLLVDNDKPDEPENRVTWAALYGNIKSFAIEFSDRMDHGGLMDVKPEILERLRQLPEIGFWNCGFSMDENDVISFHIVPRPIPGLPQGNEKIVIPLESYARMFDLTAVREVSAK